MNNINYRGIELMHADESRIQFRTQEVMSIPNGGQQQNLLQVQIILEPDSQWREFEEKRMAYEKTIVE